MIWVIQPNCIQTLIDEFEKNPSISSLSPIDRKLA